MTFGFCGSERECSELTNFAQARRDGHSSLGSLYLSGKLPTYPTPSLANISTYFSLKAKCWLRGVVGYNSVAPCKIIQGSLGLWILDCRYGIPEFFSVEFQLLGGFRIPLPELRFQSPGFRVSQDEIFQSSKIWITLHAAKLCVEIKENNSVIYI